MKSFEWALLQYDWYPNKKKKLRQRHAEERYCDNVGHLQMKERGLEQILS